MLAIFEIIYAGPHPGSLLTMDRLIEIYRVRGNTQAQAQWQALLDASDPELNGK